MEESGTEECEPEEYELMEYEPDELVTTQPRQDMEVPCFHHQYVEAIHQPAKV